MFEVITVRKCGGRVEFRNSHSSGQSSVSDAPGFEDHSKMQFFPYYCSLSDSFT